MHATAYLHHTGTGRIFVAYFRLAPVADDAEYRIKRWRCCGYHATGAISLVAAAIHMDNMHWDYHLRTPDVVDLGHIVWDGEAGLTLIAGPDNRPMNAVIVDVSGPQAVAS